MLRSLARIAARIAAYTWASPNTSLGMLLGAAVLCCGGRVQYRAGVAEFSGGTVGRLIERIPTRLRFSAITFGHVILGISEQELVAVRAHEHVHVRQYEQWGPFFLPAYALSSAWQLLGGRCIYRDNAFEKAAFAVECAAAPRPSTLQAAPSAVRCRSRSTGEIPALLN